MRTYLLSLTLAATLGLSLALPGAVMIEEFSSREQVTLRDAPPVIQESGDVQVATIEGYAKREAQATDLKSFTGGRHDDVLIVSCGCVAVVILILILI